MGKRPDDALAGSWLLDGVLYKSEDANLTRVASDERCRARKARLLARIESEHDGPFGPLCRSQSHHVPSMTRRLVVGAR
jgi:hypothetical protein